MKNLRERNLMKAWRRLLGCGGLPAVVALTVLVGSCVPWNPLSAAGIGDLKIYWVGYDRLYSANLDGSSFREIATGSGTDPYGGVAVDPINRKVYWSSYANGGEVYRADLEGTNQQTLASGVMVDFLAVDPNGGKLYFSYFENIYRMNLDGSSLESIRTSDQAIGDLRLDVVTRKLYWIEGGIIYSSALSSPLSPQTAVDGVADAVTFAVEPGGGSVYFADSAANSTIYKVGIPGGSPVPVYSFPGTVGGLDLDPFTGRLYWSRFSGSTGIYIDSVRVDASGFTPIVSQPGSGDAQRLVLYLWP